MAKTTVLGIRLTAEERAVVDARAAAVGMSSPAWAKSMLMVAAAGKANLLTDVHGQPKGTLKKGRATGRGKPPTKAPTAVPTIPVPVLPPTPAMTERAYVPPRATRDGPPTPRPFKGSFPKGGKK